MTSPIRLLAVSATLAVSVAGAAFADYPFDDLVSMDFTYDKVQLESDEGTQEVYRSLRKVALRTCTGSGTAIQDNIAVKAYAECIEGLVSAAVTSINAPQLTAMHAQPVQLASRN